MYKQLRLYCTKVRISARDSLVQFRYKVYFIRKEAFMKGQANTGVLCSSTSWLTSPVGILPRMVQILPTYRVKSRSVVWSRRVKGQEQKCGVKKTLTL